MQSADSSRAGTARATMTAVTATAPSRSIPMNTTRTPVVFIHGLWLHASSWDPWVDLFTAEGYAPVAPGWPGVPETAELARAHPDRIAGYGIDEVTTHYAAIIEKLPARPVIIGHSFGGMIAEKLLGENLGAV